MGRVKHFQWLIIERLRFFTWLFSVNLFLPTVRFNLECKEILLPENFTEITYKIPFLISICTFPCITKFKK